MKNIFVGGAYFNTEDGDISIYTKIANILKERYPDEKIFEPNDIQAFRDEYIKNNKNATLKQINEAMVDFDLQQISDSKLMIADVTNKSIGLGIELGKIRQLNKKVVFIAKTGSQTSNMVFGAFPDADIFYYKTNNIEETINEICDKYLKNS